MRNASATLIALLNSSSEFVVADLLTIVQADGTITRLTNATEDVTAVSQYDNASHTFSAGLPFTRGATKLVIGTEVDTLTVTLLPRSTDTLAGVVWPAAARAGALDNSEILLEKAIMPSWGDTSPGTLILFWGRAGSPVITRASIRLEVKSDIVLLQAPMPRNVYQAACLHTLFDAGCTLNQATFTAVGVVSGGSTIGVTTNLTAADNYYELGTLIFTTGVNAGVSRLVRTYVNSGGTVFFIVPLPASPGVGDTFTIVPGCDKTAATCLAKFANSAHFRGFPDIPVAETAR
jgi:uncharacterized phage protein (TIGR02218 family)